MLKFNIQILVFETETPRNIFSQRQRPTFRAAKRPKISSADAKLARLFSSSISCIKTTNCGHDLGCNFKEFLWLVSLSYNLKKNVRGSFISFCCKLIKLMFAVKLFFEA